MNVEVYIVPFNHGSHGTWLTWFINQHSSFPDNVELYEKFNDINNPSTLTDYGVYNASWNYDEQDISDVKLKLQGDYTKVALKLLPHHSMFSESEEKRTRVGLSAKDIIIPVVNKTMNEALEKRFRIIRPNLNNIRHESHKCIKRFQTMNPKIIDIGKIIAKDQNEYDLLLDKINENPIANWKELINNSVGKIYEY